MEVDPAELYPYASGELLEQRNTYTYSAYHGKAFLDAWRLTRARARSACNLSATPEALDGRELRALALPVRTVDLLVTLRSRMAREPLDASDDALLDRLIQRFEVTKRIHACYGTNWRATDRSDFRDLGLMLLFAECVADRQAQVARLDLLNALLKALDTLCAYVPTLSPTQQRRLAALIDKEAAFVARLAAQVAER